MLQLGTTDAAHVGFAVVERLLRLLVDERVINDTDAADMLDTLADDLAAEPNRIAKDIAPAVRAMAGEYRTAG